MSRILLLGIVSICFLFESLSVGYRINTLFHLLEHHQHSTSSSHHQHDQIFSLFDGFDLEKESKNTSSSDKPSKEEHSHYVSSPENKWKPGQLYYKKSLLSCSEILTSFDKPQNKSRDQINLIFRPPIV